MGETVIMVLPVLKESLISQITFLFVLAILFLFTTGLMLAIGYVKPMHEPFVLKQNNHVSIVPWKNRHLASLVLIIAMMLIYLVFSPLGIVK